MTPDQISSGESRPWALSCSIQVSTRTKCNGYCKFCIAATTPGASSYETALKFCSEDRLRVGLNYARNLGASHAILTSKAEPTQEDSFYLCWLVKMSRQYLPLVDMHTNGFLLTRGSKSDLLSRLTEAGLTMVTFSIASFDKDKNKNLMGLEQNTEELIAKALELGLLVRCSLVVNKSGEASGDDVLNYIYQAANLGVHMVVIREVWIPDTFMDTSNKVLIWNRENQIPISPLQDKFMAISKRTSHSYGLRLRDPLPWGTPVFTIDGYFDDPSHGINITFARCDEASVGRIFKSIVHTPDGHGYRNWDSKGDILY
ncbi:MAG: radical SAM protein [Candidatus Buchananbacteria bacterium]|nr:radical SAM protein [Candidatus Buchananbacteria bacterium]